VTALAAPRMPEAPHFTAPRNACDTHTHVFGAPDAFSAGPSSYPIPLATAQVHRAALAAMGVDRAVVVQPAPYGTDTGALEHALAAGGGRLAGIAAAAAAVSDSTLDRLHGLGVRGLRFNLRTDPRTGAPFQGAIGAADLQALAPRLRERGWHAQIWAALGAGVRVVDFLAAHGVTVVLDHMAQLVPGRGVDDPGFRRLVDQVRDGAAWVKLSLCRVSAAPGYTDVRPFHDALVAANPDRLLWGSDWPHVAMGEDAPDAGRLLDVLAEWTADDDLLRRILVANPSQLFDFTEDR
jgi:predicted TIM-barrel fold metal-dependent hydrolase